MDNIHDELAPEQSAALLKAHVASGIDLAYQYKLPKPIIAFIPQHHGTALMSYFYARAKEQAWPTRRTPARRRPDADGTVDPAASATPGPSRSRARRRS